MGFDMLIGTTGSHLLLLPEVREMTAFGRGEQVSQVPVDCWLLSYCQESSVVQAELISSYMEHLRPDASKSTNHLYHIVALEDEEHWSS